MTNMESGGGASATPTPFVEEADFVVTLTLTNTITFSPIERDTPLNNSDAIGNAYGTVSDIVWRALRAEGWHIEETVERIG